MSCPTEYFTYSGRQCDPSSTLNSQGSEGITTWGFPSAPSYTISPSASQTISFTCTEPRCYHTQDVCNALFYSYVSSTPSGSDAPLDYYLNGGSKWGGCFLSPIIGHGSWQAIDLSQVSNNPYTDVGLNTFKITNNSSATVVLADFQIIRGYQMCNFYAETFSLCCTSAQPCTAMGLYCSTGSTAGTLGNLDYLRADHPCNCETGGGLSYSSANCPQVSGASIPANGGCFKFAFDWSPTYTSGNYQQGSICLFNFNQLFPTQNSSNNDVTLSAYLNGSQLTTYYLSKTSTHGQGPSYNLMNSSAYTDTGWNTITIVNNSDVPVRINDPHGINIYRCYKTNSVVC